MYEKYDKIHRYNVTLDSKMIADLFNIIGNMNINEVKQYMIVEQIPYNIVDASGNTLIHRVLQENDVLKTESQRLHIIQYLYNENVNPDSPNNMNITPLHIACMKQYKTIVKYFIDLGVDVNYKDNFGNTPLHRLLSGNIRPEEKITPGNILPYPKKQDTIKTTQWTIERNRLWDEIKDSQFIRSIDETMKHSIGSNSEEIYVVKSFQEQLLTSSLDLTKADDIKKLKDLQGASINKFKSIIESKWMNFPNLGDITIHTTEPDSYPQNDPSKLSIIKNSNINKRTMNNLARAFADINKLLSKKQPAVNINNKDINMLLLEAFINNAKTALTNGTINAIYDKYTEFTAKFKHTMTVDFADNVIDMNNMTFIGGARDCTIIDDIDPDILCDIFNKNDIIPIFAYCLIVDIKEAIMFGGTYDIAVNNALLPVYDLVVRYIVDYINNVHTLIQEQELIIAITTNIPHQQSITQLIINKNTNRINWLYCFINVFLCNEYNNIHGGSSLICDIRMGVMLLIAGLINDKTDLVLSISQASRIQLMNIIISNVIGNERTGFSKKVNHTLAAGSIFSALVYIMFSTDSYETIYNNLIDHNPQTEDEFITLFNRIGSNYLNKLLIYSFRVINKNDKPKHNLCTMLSEYMGRMEQPPQMQHVADIIGIARMCTTPQSVIDRITHMGIINRPLNGITNNIYEAIDGSLVNIDITTISSKLFKIIGNMSDAVDIWTVNEHSLPSRVNYFLYKPLSVLYGLVDEEKRTYTLKFIECYYLGLNFMGRINAYSAIDTIDIDNNTIPTTVNLFNFSATVQTPLLHFTAGDKMYRPTNIISIANVLRQFENNINHMITQLTTKIKLVLYDFHIEKSSLLYATVISYLYPVLVSLWNYSKIFINMNKSILEYIEPIEYIKQASRQYDTPVDDIGVALDFVLFPLATFEQLINTINSYLFMQYYMNGTDIKIKIPKFLYHSLGGTNMIVFDKIDSRIKMKPTNSDTLASGLTETDTSHLDYINGVESKDIGLYQTVINNVNYVDKQILDQYYVMSKNKKLPPSLRNILVDFYWYNLIQIIQTTATNINPTIIDTNVTANISVTMKDIQLQYIKAKMIEELIQLYLRNKIYQYGVEIYQKVIQNKLSPNIDIERIFDTVNFSATIQAQPTDTLINSVSSGIITPDVILLYYSFVEPRERTESYILYPDNYFGTNLLNNKYCVRINMDIIKYILDHDANILIHNDEKISPLVMLMKNLHYEGLNVIKQYIDFKDYANNDYAPSTYMLNIYKNHLLQYTDTFTNSQYNEIVQIIQANDTHYNNILKYMDTSFKVVKYLTEQYITENMLRFTDNYTSNDMTQTLNSIGFGNDVFNMKQTTYNKHMHSLTIPANNEGIVIASMIKDNIQKIKICRVNLDRYIKERDELIKLQMPTDSVDRKILDVNNNLASLDALLQKIKRIPTPPQPSIIMNQTEPKIIARYDNMLAGMYDNMLCYMEGWKQLILLISNDTIKSVDIVPTYLIKSQAFQHNNLDILYRFYNHSSFVKSYFEQPRYIDNNKVLRFVNDLLIHVTKTFICSNIESIIKKILFDFLENTSYDGSDKVNYIFEGIKDSLYNTVPKLFVKNSVNIYESREDEASSTIQTVADILNNLIDLLKTSSPIEINLYTINMIKNNVVQYFDTITYKLIYNWNVVIENIFIYHINHGRIISCLHSILL